MDPFVLLTYILIGVVFIATLGIQFYLQRTYAKYSRVANSRGYTGEQVARSILDAYGLQNVRVEMVPGALTDHYDPMAKAVRLSEPNFHSPSAAALAVAAHEVGHAIQDAKAYAWLRARASILPVASIGSNLGPIIFMIGLFMGSAGGTFMTIGILLFAAAALFQLITLPVEFDASNRALTILKKMNFLEPSEMSGARSVLTAAALTYVAALATTVAWLLNYAAIMMSQREE
ncbi:MAG: zinc metallopeptidase [Meiothermus sp.]|nr:zinc metallopeptidase [Meiothermus sp.]